MKMTFAMLLVAVTVAGCATRKVWVQDGVDDAQFSKDQGYCVAQAKGAPNPMNEGGVYRGCMEGKGWKLKKVPR